MNDHRKVLCRMCLLENPEFVLLYVPKRGAQKRMRLVRPAVDPDVQKELQHWESRTFGRSTLPYYALSHLWGIPDAEKDQHMWDDIGDFVDDEEGNPVKPVPMRAEKRQTLLALLESMSPFGDLRSGTYWWIDVLCARSSTPLVIMGDIYRYCEECCAMIDCPPKVLECLSKTKERDQIFNDYHRMVAEIDKDAQAALFNKFVERWPERLLLMDLLTQCQWWNRVWTWQEAALSSYTWFISETSVAAPTRKSVWSQLMQLLQGNHRTPSSQETKLPIFTCANFKKSGKAIAKQTLSIIELTPLSFCDQLEDSYIRQKFHQETSADTIKMLQMISNPLREISKTWYQMTNRSDIPPFFEAITDLSTSTRTCMDPVDYVYGVLGFINLDVPRMENHHDVWACFLQELEQEIQYFLSNQHYEYKRMLRVNHISISDKARKFDLSTARNMGQVYSGLLNVTYTHP